MSTRLDRRIERVAAIALALLLTALLAMSAWIHVHQKKNAAYLLADVLVWLFGMGICAVKYHRLSKQP
jgi:peptidoglycan/LPS O-acetylase OafA/YrhL